MRALSVAMLGVACALAACRSVLGIDDLPAAPEDGGVNDAGGLDGAGVDGGADSTGSSDGPTGALDAPPGDGAPPADAPPDAPPGSPADWAEWPLPPIALANGNYTLTTDTATDTVTGLMWMRASSGSLDFPSAQAYCAAQNAGGFSDWRMPSWIELVTLVDYTRGFPAINTSTFPGTPSDWFWASTPILTATLQQCVFFGDGSVNALSTNAATTARMRCVRKP